MEKQRSKNQKKYFKKRETGQWGSSLTRCVTVHSNRQETWTMCLNSWKTDFSISFLRLKLSDLPRKNPLQGSYPGLFLVCPYILATRCSRLILTVDFPCCRIWNQLLSTALTFFNRKDCQKPKCGHYGCISVYAQLALHIHRFNQISERKCLKNSRNLNLQHTGIYLYSVYIVFTTAYIAFTLVRRFKQSRDELKYKEDVEGCSRIT